jgi:hypothetical protein
MKYRLLILFSILSVNCIAQETPAFDGHNYKAPYFLDSPQNWGIERFLIPISFAPSISYKGVEDIRFMPGWAKKESVEYWSYAFLWYLDGAVKPDEETIKKNLVAYYTGLLYANADSARAKTITTATATVKKIPVDKKAENSFQASVSTLDFLTWQPITLHLRIHVLGCKEENKTLIFHEVSPKQHNDDVWPKLRALWLSLRCKK